MDDNINISILSKEELDWIPSYLKAREQLEELKDDTKDPMYKLVNSYYMMMKMVLTCHNLVFDNIEYGAKVQKAIRINRAINPKELDNLGVEHCYLNGHCVISSVIFFEPQTYEDYINSAISGNSKESFKDINLDFLKRITTYDSSE